MLDRLEGAFKSQRQFLADTSHDLRTPLSVIRSNVEVALEDPTPTVEEWIATGEIVVRNAERMGTMIDGLLAAARFQNGQAVMVTIDLAGLTREAAGDLTASAAATNVALAVISEPAVVHAEPTSLTRALNNLIDNALRVAPKGSALRIASGQVDGWAYLAVADQGPGFEPARVGSGLGLSIVEQVAQLHGGKFAVFPRHEQGRGSTTVIWLPTDTTSGPPPAENPVP
jgi:signal transduction histidine kinase